MQQFNTTTLLYLDVLYMYLDILYIDVLRVLKKHKSV